MDLISHFENLEIVNENLQTIQNLKIANVMIDIIYKRNKNKNLI